LQEELKSFAENKKIMEALIARLADEKDELEIARDQIDMSKSPLLFLTAIMLL
jgi:cell division protein FtsB